MVSVLGIIVFNIFNSIPRTRCSLFLVITHDSLAQRKLCPIQALKTARRCSRFCGVVRTRRSLANFPQTSPIFLLISWSVFSCMAKVLPSMRIPSFDASFPGSILACWLFVVMKAVFSELQCRPISSRAFATSSIIVLALAGVVVRRIKSSTKII